ncbi:MAG TPA: adenosylcobinamide-GDP ribazoletransferase [Sedimenticola sp.]|nr:adenosylcobinamide-GDP ribazoletransferase [Sedimenticola sp.]
MLKPLLIALQLLTRLPLPDYGRASDRQIGCSLLCYPLVGLLIGGILALTAWATSGAADGVRAALLLAVWTLITGALHLDGLADSADAWLGGYGDREKTLAIMKDPCSGPAGVTVVVLVLIAKYASLEALLSQANHMALILVPTLTRALLPLLLLTTDYVRTNGMGSVLSSHHPRRASLWVVLGCAGMALAIAGSKGMALLAVLAAVFLCLRFMMIKRIEGTTGDTMGALLEISEAAALMASALLPADIS